MLTQKHLAPLVAVLVAVLLVTQSSARERNSEHKIAVKSVPVSTLPASDLSIVSAVQTSPDFWIVRVKNIGQGEAGPSKLQVQMSIPQSKGGFPGGQVASYTFEVSPVKAGAVTDVNVKTKMKTKPGMHVNFVLNPDHTVKESHFENNSVSKEANPGYP